MMIQQQIQQVLDKHFERYARKATVIYLGEKESKDFKFAVLSREIHPALHMLPAQTAHGDPEYMGLRVILVYRESYLSAGVIL